MEKPYLFIVCLLLSCLLFSGCNLKQSNSTIKYQRRFEKYLPATNNAAPKTIDLSEGPKTRYDAKLGPRDLDFDVKLNVRY